MGASSTTSTRQGPVAQDGLQERERLLPADTAGNRGACGPDDRGVQAVHVKGDVDAVREVLLLNESTASVDYRSAELIEDLLLDLGPRLPLVVVSHNMCQARRLANTLYLMRDGEVAGQWSRDTGDESSLDSLLGEAF